MKYYWFFLIVLAGLGCQPANEHQTDVLIAGGGTSGVAAALQAARMGQEVTLVSETSWLGGMLTAAGVSATDGNHLLPAGIWGEFRNKLYDHYGGPKAIETGWVSNTFFEPHVGDSIFKALVAEQPNIHVVYGYYPAKALKNGNTLQGVKFRNDAGETLTVRATMTIDATELGDVMAMAGVPYVVGQDARQTTGEKAAPEQATNIIQDLTYVAILKDYGPGANKTLEKPEGYNPEPFWCACQEACNTGKEVLPCEQLITYGELPNGKYMINWPNNGNDAYIHAIDMTREERLQAYEEAKNVTRQFIYFLQTEAGFSHLGLATDEFPTDDHFPLIPYHRESRRMKGAFQMNLQDIKQPYQAPHGALYKTGIAVGDYPVDHHHTKYPGEMHEGEFPKIPSYSIPYVCLVPPQTNGLLVAEKSISVTHLANGTTRLQPVVLQIGQAAGAAAALCVKQGISPRELPVRTLQQTLLDAHMWIMPTADVTPADAHFQAVMRTCAAGIMRGEGQPIAWANRTWFYPDSQVTQAAFADMIPRMRPQWSAIPQNDYLSVGQAVAVLQQLAAHDKEETLTEWPSQPELWPKALPDASQWQARASDTISRAELAVLIDALLKPFAEPVAMVPEHN